MALWGTGYDQGRAFVEIEHRNKMIQHFWTQPGVTQSSIKQAVTEAMRGGFTLHVTQVRENRAYLDSRKVEVPWSNKDLELKWDHFTSKLEPAQKETWTLSVTGPNAEKSAAEMVAALYDESLDAFAPQRWLERFAFFRQDYSSASSTFENSLKSFQHLKGSWNQLRAVVNMQYRHFPADLVGNYWGYQFLQRKGLALPSGGAPLSAAVASFDGAVDASLLSENAIADKRGAEGGRAEPKPAAPPGAASPKSPDLTSVTARKNLNETAFFFPHLIADKDGAAIDALRQGAYDYVTKPFDLDEVHQIVERGIANRRLKAINRQLVEELRDKNAILERHEQELRERVQLATRQMTMLYEVGKEISANLELEPRLHLVATRSAEQTGAPAAVVYLKRQEQEEFTPAAVHGFEWSVREVNAGNVIPRDGVLAPAAYEQQTVRLAPPPDAEAIAVPGLPGVRCRTLLALLPQLPGAGSCRPLSRSSQARP
jgi:hypothetical protein